MKALDDIAVLSSRSWDGHADEFTRRRGELLRRLPGELGGIGVLRFFGVRIVVVFSPSLAHEVLVDKARSFEKTLAVKMSFHPLARKGLFTSDGELWRRQRRLMAPLFQPAAVRGYADMMNTVIGRYLDGWRDGAALDVGREMTRLTMGVAGKVLFDADTFDEADELAVSIQALFSYVTQQGGRLPFIARVLLASRILGVGERWPQVEPLAQAIVEGLSQPTPWPTAERRALFAAIGSLDRMIAGMIADRRRVGLSRTDVLSRLLAAQDEDDGSVMPDRQVCDEALTLFVAGHETTATSTTWALHLLSRHPDVYRRFQAEVDALGGRQPTAADAPQLGYTLAIFKETMRLYPPAVLLDRTAIEEVEIGGYLLPRFTPVLVCPYALHRQEDQWPDPERFDPDRFTPEAEAARHRMAYLPFGAGPRVCIGASFAQLEAQLLLAQIGQRFDLEAGDLAPVEPNFLSALRPARPVVLRVRARGAPRPPAPSPA